jgi:hypothetical protein
VIDFKRDATRIPATSREVRARRNGVKPGSGARPFHRVSRPGTSQRNPASVGWRAGCNRRRTMPTTWLLALAGGVLIGAASALLFLTHGRIAGISGVVGGLLPGGARHDRGWRAWFAGGVLAAGVVAAAFAPDAVGVSPRSTVAIAAAGLLVGFGTRLGNGCTSGHGVCGLSRLSARSLVAVATFMAAGAITAGLVP